MPLIYSESERAYILAGKNNAEQGKIALLLKSFSGFNLHPP